MRKFTWFIAATTVALSVPALGQDRDAAELAQEMAEDAAETAADEWVEGEAEADEFTDEEYPQPLNNSYQWVQHADYPIEAWRAGMEGEVIYRLQVNAEGKVTDCVVDESSGHPSLDKLTCDLASERAKFAPGVDENGQPVAGEYSSYFNWTKLEPEWRTGFLVKVQYVLDEEGRQSACTIMDVSDYLPESLRYSLERQPCPTGDIRPGIPYRDADGNPVARQVTIQYTVDVAPVPQDGASGD